MKKKQKEKIHSKICSRHDCHNLLKQKCKFCGFYFCDKHLKAFKPFIGIDESWEKHEGDGGHPCPAYVIFKMKEEKRKKEEYSKNLNRLLGSKSINKNFKEIEDSEPIIHHHSLRKTNHHSKHEEEELNELSLKNSEEKTHTKKKKRIIFPWKIFFKIIIVLILIAVIYFNWAQIINFIGSFNEKGQSEQIKVDSQTLEFFKYVNDYRTSVQSPELNYSNDLYGLVKEAVESKDINSESFESYEQFRIFISNKINLSSIKTSFYRTYFIKGEGMDGFSKEFNRNLQARNIIKDSKYKNGVIYCGVDNCILFIYSGEIAPLTSFESEENLLGEAIQEKEVETSKRDIDIIKLEMEVHNLINQQRINHGLKGLSWDSKLSEIARKHSQDMANNNFFDHYNLQGQDPTDRANKMGYSCRKDYGSYYTDGIAENIFQNNLYDSVTTINFVISTYDWNTLEEIASSTVSGWMLSQGHRENILTSTYDKEGIGVAISSDDKVYITENFC